MKQRVQWPIVCRDGEKFGVWAGFLMRSGWRGCNRSEGGISRRAKVIFDHALTLSFPRNQSQEQQKMLELPFVQGNLLKKVLEALKHLVIDANFIVLHLDFLSKPWIEAMD